MPDQISTIPKGWKMTTIGKVADKITKGTTPTTIGGEFVKNGINFIKAESISDYGYFIKNKFSYISQGIDDKMVRSRLAENDILFSIAGVIGRVVMVPKHVLPANINQALAIIRPTTGKIYFKYLFYFLFDPRQKALANSGVAQSVQANVNLAQVGSIEINLPPLPEQHAIAAALSSLDDKIELLREQNKTLEATSQAIFKEWFVNFNFPGATGKMTNSELGKIPVGWRAGKLGDELKIEYGKSDKKFDANGIYPVYGAGGIVGYSNSTDYKDYQVIIGCRGTCGNITLAYEDSKITHNSLIISNHWFKPFIYLFLQKVDIKKAITGSTQPQITIGDLSNIEITIPPKEIADNFSEIITPIFKKLKNNNSQIQTLSALRDTLLPKLMSGELRLNKKDEQ